MEALILSIPYWFTDLVLRVSMVLLAVAFGAVVIRAFVEFNSPVIEDDYLEPEFELRCNGEMTQAEFDRAYGVQR